MIGQGGVSPVLGTSQGDLPQWYGIYYGVISNNADPKNKNRAMLRVPQLLGKGATTWAVSLTPQQDKPKIGTIVAAMFIGGDIDYPCYLVVDPAIKVETTSGNIQPVGTVAAAGTSTAVAAADHVHTLANALESTSSNIQPLGTQAAGTSVKAARADHVHAMLTWITSLLSGISGQIQIDSGTTGVADNTSDVILKSKNKAGTGSAEIDLNTDIVITSKDMQVGNNLEVTNLLTVDNNADINGILVLGNGVTSSLTLNPQMVPPTGWPFATGAGATNTQVNALSVGLNGVINSLRAHDLMQ
jgi:hypothetical protein